MNNETKTLFTIGAITLAVLVGVIYVVSMFSNKAAEPKVADTAILVRPDSRKITAKQAKVTLVEFADFQCPACAAAHPVVKQLLEDHKGSITFVSRNFPLVTTHQNAFLAALSAEAAGKQGHDNYWQMYDKLYETQALWSTSNDARDIFIRYATELKLNKEAFIKDIDNQTFKDKINKDMQDGITAGVDSTPTFYINGTKFEGTYRDLPKAINQIISSTP